MSTHKKILLTAILTFCLTGCYSSYAPFDWEIPTEENISSDPFGSFIYIEYDTNRVQRKDFYSRDKYYLFYDYKEYWGEFIGVEGDSICILSPSFKLYKFHNGRILFAGLEVLDNSTSSYVAWTMLGTLSTISHGFLLILTAPMWIITGTATVASLTRNDKYQEELPNPYWWTKMTKFSRFPQGIPDTLSKLKQWEGRRFLEEE